eukprot:scaffold37258_cov47-Prasinocladus_malaysianus.AAC.2
MIGQVADAERLHANLTAAWHRFGWLPELFDLGIANRHPMEKGYPLRPELIESTYLLHSETGDPRYLEVARDLQQYATKGFEACFQNLLSAGSLRRAIPLGADKALKGISIAFLSLPAVYRPEGLLCERDTR